MTTTFELGRILMTPGAEQAFDGNMSVAVSLLRRHASGDWGEVPSSDAELNDAALKDGSRILSACTISSGHKLWIITEADRSCTTILLPEEY